MAGSRRWFAYDSDNNERYSVQIDESNGEAVTSEQSYPLFDNRTVRNPPLPRGTGMRYCWAYALSAPSRQRKFWVGSRLAAAAIIDGEQIVEAIPTSNPGVFATETWIVTSFIGETLRLIPPVQVSGGDTGLNDGDGARDGNG